MKRRIVVVTLIVSSFGLVHSSSARETTLTGGISCSYEFNDRTYHLEQDDNMTAEEAARTEKEKNEQNDYNRIRVSPLILLVSESETDLFEIRFNPAIRYDVDDDDYDMDQNFFAGFEKELTKKLSFSVSEQFVSSDYQNVTWDGLDETTTEDDTDPSLTTDIGRRKYWKNTAKLSSKYRYGDDRHFGMGLSSIVLRNDEDAGQSYYNDYDRSEIFFKNVHRFDVRWKTSFDVKYIQGDFEEDIEDDETATEDPVSRDLQEYRLNATLENNSLRHDPVFFTYGYIGARYDDPLQVDDDVHQGMVKWQHFIDEEVYTIFGVGPSYMTSESDSGSWGVNGIAAYNHQSRHTILNIQIEKLYDVDNFSGNDERGVVNSWVASVKLNHQLLEKVGFFAGSAYTYEDRNYSSNYLENNETTDSSVDDTEGKDDYHVDTIIGYAGLQYSFMENYSLQLKYNYLYKDSDRNDKNYDEHRVVLALSWQEDLFQW